VTGVGFRVISGRGASPLRLMLSGAFMGLGIVAMHYTGMAAMRGHADLSIEIESRAGKGTTIRI
jgi:NO-binding membrane sensor protein with MHYT domain